MQYTTTLLLATSAALLAHAQDASGPEPSTDLDPTDAYLATVCMPLNSTGYPDMTAPCNEVQAVQSQCIFGPSEGLAQFYSIYGALANSSTLSRRQTDTGDDSDPTEQSNSTQRVCICESQFFDLLQGCFACEKAHGAPYAEAQLPQDFFASMSSAYCAASATPTADLPDFLNDYASSSISGVSTSATSSFSDPLANQTAVSLYYTQAVTGSAAWVVAEASTTGASGSAAAGTTTNTVSGQIRPTASGATTSVAGSASPVSGSGTGTSTGGAMRTEAASVAGVLGFAGLLALL